MEVRLFAIVLIFELLNVGFKPVAFARQFMIETHMLVAFVAKRIALCGQLVGFGTEFVAFVGFLLSKRTETHEYLVDRSPVNLATTDPTDSRFTLFCE